MLDFGGGSSRPQHPDANRGPKSHWRHNRPSALFKVHRQDRGLARCSTESGEGSSRVRRRTSTVTFDGRDPRGVAMLCHQRVDDAWRALWPLDVTHARAKLSPMMPSKSKVDLGSMERAKSITTTLQLSSVETSNLHGRKCREIMSLLLRLIMGQNTLRLLSWQ